MVPSGSLVATPSEEQVKQSISFKKFERLHRHHVEEFRTSLIQYPMLGAQDPFGQLLVKSMRKAKNTVLQPSCWYRAVAHTPDPDFEPRSRYETINAGRYNQIGQRVWYLGSDEKTAAVEKLRAPRSGCPLSIGKIELLESLTVLDLRATLGGEDPIGQWILRNVVDRRFVSEPTNDVDKSRPQYRVPQFIADLARQRRFRGILYDSTRPSPQNNPEAVGHNLVVFDPIPLHKKCSHAALEFAEDLEYDVMFSMERWRLLPIKQVER
jgi:hypothetical protein